VRWYGTGHLVDMSAESRQLAFCLHGASQNDVDIYVMINAAPTSIEFGIQEGMIGTWKVAIDTSRPSPHDIIDGEPSETVEAATYQVSARSVVVLVAVSA